MRQRDAYKNESGWADSAFNLALQGSVGLILLPFTKVDAVWFLSLPQGDGALPQGVTTSVLTLEVALNKLKHRDTVAVNFSVIPHHSMFVHTLAGMGKKDSLSEIDVLKFCKASAVAAGHI